MYIYKVEQGENLSRIAKKYGFTDAMAIYSHAKNAALRYKRPDPNLLYPGDIVNIPEKKKSGAIVKTGSKHKF